MDGAWKYKNKRYLENIIAIQTWGHLRIYRGRQEKGQLVAVVAARV
jgi:hypothetical protein